MRRSRPLSILQRPSAWWLLLAPLVLTLMLAACSPDPEAEPGVDRVFVNGAVYTLDENQPWAEAVAVDGSEIVYVGDMAGAQAMSGENTIQHDLDGKMLLPGLIDTHMHPIAGGAYAKALSLETGGTVDEWIQAIADHAAENRDAPLIFGYGWLSTTFGPEGPQR